MNVKMLTRELPLRPRRLGTHARRAPRGAQVSGGMGAGRGAERRGGAAASLDNSIYLATSSQSTSQAKQSKGVPQYATLWHYAKAMETPHDKYKQRIRLQEILLETMRSLSLSSNAPVATRGQRQRDYERLHNCQREWIGFKASCCDSRTVAVPIGCNHRLCVLCNGHRSEVYREKVRELFGRLEIPLFLTLTIPSLPRLSKRSYSRVRNAVRSFLKANKAWIKGGIYALETTYNAKHGWHLHVHLLLDSAMALPNRKPDFIRFKRRLEFDWLRLTGGREWRDSDFAFWFAQTGTAQNGEWNKINRRVVDIRPVRDRNRAAMEVLKYITKITDFVALPAVVSEFLGAVRGVRMLQTFGSWYGVKFEDDVNKTWKKLQCECGANEFTKIGKLTREMVFMDKDGLWTVLPEWHVRPPGVHNHDLSLGQYGAKAQREIKFNEETKKCRMLQRR